MFCYVFSYDIVLYWSTEEEKEESKAKKVPVNHSTAVMDGIDDINIYTWLPTSTLRLRHVRKVP